MIWLLLAVMVVVVVVALVVVALDGGRSPRSAASYQARVELHGIRTRQEAAQLKSAIDRDAAQARRELRAELHGLSKRERQP